jgi:hypothetical protein
MRIDRHESPDRVDHRTPESHWCGECRRWVVDCDHVVSPLPIRHVAVNDGWIRSLSYDRRHGRLEIEFKWNDTTQFWPVSPALFKELWRGQPRYLVLNEKIIGDRRIRSAFVRTDGKVLVSMLWALPRCVR